jgi:hypothetical protein
MKQKGKDYVRCTGNRLGDLYDSPYSTLWTLLEHEKFSDCLEPCSGNGALLKAAPKGMYINKFDLFKDGIDFLDYPHWNGDIITILLLENGTLL